MTRKVHYLLALMLGVSLYNTGLAQDNSNTAAQYEAAPKDMWEVGVNVGHILLSGDADYKPGFGGGVHVRKALDYVFSLRGDAMFGVYSGGGKRTNSSNQTVYDGFKGTWASGDLSVVASLNNLIWKTKPRKFNLYAFAGGGLNFFKVELNKTPATEVKYYSNQDFKANLDLAAGVGIAFKVSDKFNIGIENKGFFIFGARADLLDGASPNNGSKTSFRDALNYTDIRLNFNLGDKQKLSQPLYWANPLESVINDIAELKARPKLDLTDTDGDGVIDMLDQEKETPKGAPVDTRGVSLDSDGDGYADYKDKEPYSPPGYKVDNSGVAQVPKPDFTTKDDVNRIVDGKLAGFEPKGGGGVVDWFLPMIHFDLDKYGVNRSEFEKLHYVASVLKSNPKVKIVVTGFTDKSASDKYNNVLSYNRANAAIQHLITVYGISKDRLILNWNGENDSLVPSNGKNYMNRRAEFRVATDKDKDMARPEGPNAGKGNFKGSKNDGY